MKLVRWGQAGHERPGLIDADGRLRDLSALMPDIEGAQLGDEALAQLAQHAHASLPIVLDQPRLGCPVAGVGKFIAIGLNYADHAAESGMPIPQEPIIFTKAISCIQGPNDDVMLPKDSTKTDWEVELGVVIGKTARYVSDDDALDHVAGYCIVNDVSEREFQLERGGSWDKGKGCDTFGPIGPWLLTRDEVPDPQKLGLWLNINGERVQTGNTRTMIFSVARLIGYVSRFMTLEPGDVLATGTPPGVGMGRVNSLGEPAPRFLKAGDTMTLGIDGLGIQHQQVVDFRP